MNERIRELKNQAAEYANEVFEYHGKDYREIVMEKFSELIVKECAELATKEYNNRGAIHGNDLLEHFGVE